MQQIIFKSKKDKWLTVVMILMLPVSLIAIFLTVTTAPISVAWASVPLTVAGALLPLWLMRTTQYSLDQNTLFIQSGPFKWRVPINEIHKIEQTRNPLNSPALSLDRLRIEYGEGKWIMISPEDKTQFLSELKLRQQGKVS